ncbi:MAG TPA: hypothetical protein VMY41_13735, partial [Thermohalobaculum sp.]|nr:hypothetical protein [Thermohalobaculum sp.]
MTGHGTASSPAKVVIVGAGFGGLAATRELANANAGQTDNADERRRQLTFAVVGAGPTGVEIVGAIAELASRGGGRDQRGVKLSGFPAWLLWAVAHVYFLIGARNRVVVVTNWLWSCLTFDRGANLLPVRRRAYSARRRPSAVR